MAMTHPQTSPSVLFKDAQILGWHSRNDQEYHLAIDFRFRDAHCSIQISAESFSHSPVALEVFQIHVRHFSTDEDIQASSRLWEYSSCIIAPFLDELDALVPKPARPITMKYSLDDIAYKQYLNCTVRVFEDEVTIGEISELNLESEDDKRYEKYVNVVHSTSNIIDDIFHILRLSDVTFDPLPVGISPKQVFADEKPLLWKSRHSFPSQSKELLKHQKIQTSRLTFKELLVARLHAIVLDSKDRIRGYLYDWIDNRGNLTSYMNRQPSPSLELRQKWAKQLQQTVMALHGLEVTWGDVKCDNVLIDDEENAVIIDLEGGTTKGWVDFEMEDTVAGDLQGMKRMLGYILHDESFTEK